MRQRIVDAESLQSNQPSLTRPNSASPSGSDPTAAVDSSDQQSFFRNLRQREAEDQSILRTFGAFASPGFTWTPSTLQQVPSFDVFGQEHEAAKIHFSLDGARLVLDVWVDEDGVTVTDEPRTMVLLDAVVGSGGSASTSESNTARGSGYTPVRDFGVGSFLMTALSSSGFLDVGPRFSLRRVSIPRALLQQSLSAVDAPMMGPVVRRVRLLLAHQEKQLRAGNNNKKNDSPVLGGRELSVIQRLRLRSEQDEIAPSSEGGNEVELQPAEVTIIGAMYHHCLTKGTLATPHASPSSSVGGAQHCEHFLRVVTQPFTDAEVFQLLYVQLLLKRYFNAHLDPERWMCPVSATGRRQFRADYLAIRASGRQSLAFEFPHKPDFWLHFPSKSNVVSLLNVHHVVVVKGSSEEEQQQRPPVKLVGSTPPGLDWEPLPTVSYFGRYLLDTFASAIVLNTPQDAEVALKRLFDQCGQLYLATREQLWETHIAPRVFRCGVAAERRLRGTKQGNHDPVAPPIMDQFLAADVLARLLRDPRPARPPSTLGPAASGSPPSRHRFQEGGDRATTRTSPLVDPSEEFMQRWKRYAMEGPDQGNLNVFHDDDDRFKRIRVGKVLGRGGSGIVFRGTYTTTDGRVLNVAVKCFVLLDGGRSLDDNIKEALPDAAFFASVFNLINNRGLCPAARAYDFVVTDLLPEGMQREDWVVCARQEHLLAKAKPAAPHPNKKKNNKKNNKKGGGKREKDHHEEEEVDVLASTTKEDDPATGLAVHPKSQLVEEVQYPNVKLCYLVVDLMDQTVGRFLGPADEDYDPVYDTLRNEILTDHEVFQLLYSQLLLRYLFDYTVQDLMLHGQLRGDNLGLRSVRSVLLQQQQQQQSSSGTTTSHAGDSSSLNYDALWYHIPAKQNGDNAPPRYLRFPLHAPETQLLRPEGLHFLFFIDVGQGILPGMQRLTQKGLIASSVVESCLSDDGMGRYWPLDRLVGDREVKGHSECGQRALRWAEQVRLPVVRQEEGAHMSLEDRFEAFSKAVEPLMDIFAPYQTGKGVSPPPETVGAQPSLVWGCSRERVATLKSDYLFGF